MINYQQKRYWKTFLLVFAVLISIGTLFYTQKLVKELSREQRKMVNIIADTYRQINTLTMEGKFDEITYLWEVILSNDNIPLILTDSNFIIIESKNIDSARALDTAYLEKQLEIMKVQQEPITIQYSTNNKHYIFYKDSRLIQKLRIYPFIQLGLVILFILSAYFAFNSSKKYEQNKVWTGMSRETAHQLGTPVSSLLGLNEYLKSTEKITPEILNELEKDTHRLELITDRFSKIGSVPKYEQVNIINMINQSINYLKPRVSKRVEIIVHENENEIIVPVIPSLFDWVLENLVKNAINAMEGTGKIEVHVIDESENHIFIDISDTGKGIPKSKQSTIFKAGYTTSKSGWGLGLSLVKRIIELYHKGNIFVKNSEIGKGTTFRIKLNKEPKV
jgi:two-component system, sporulation sensor kinase D